VAGDEVALEIDAHQTTRDQQGNVKYTVIAGKPFTVNVKINGQADGSINFQAPSHTSMRHFGTQKSFSSMNGSMSCALTHNYQAVVDKEGEIVFGPVKVTIDGKAYQSEALRVHVVKDVAEQGLTLAKKGSDIFCRATSDKKHVVIGEPIIVTLSIYVRCQIEQIGLEPYHFEGFLIKELPDKQQRKEIVDGNVCVVMEKQFLLHATDEGTKKIKPFTVIFDKLVQDTSATQNFFGMAMFGGVRSERGKVSSNPLDIVVKKLPHTSGAINGVGRFTQCTASVDKSEAVVNEPILFCLTVKGSSHFDQVAFDHPELPSFCKFYSSKSATTYDDQNQLTGTKRFEFVVQVGQAGTIELPAQKFTFFDTQKQTYQTLATKPITLTIKSSPDGKATMPVAQEDLEKQKTDNEKEEKKHEEPILKDIHFIYEDFGQDRPIKALPGWFFSAIVLLVLAGWMIRSYLSRKYRIPFSLLSGRRKHEKKLLHIKKKIEFALDEGNVSSLYQLFIVFVCTQLNLQQEDFSEQVLAQVLAEKGWQQATIAEFLDFLNACASIRFGAGKQQQRFLDDVRQQAAKWLLFLVK